VEVASLVAGAQKIAKDCSEQFYTDATQGDHRVPAIAGKEVPAWTVAVVRSPDFLRVSIREIALATLIHQRRLTPSCGGHVPYRGENSGPGKDGRGELDTQTRN
jgi:hypothetical protein